MKLTATTLNDFLERLDDLQSTEDVQDDESFQKALAGAREPVLRYALANLKYVYIPIIEETKESQSCETKGRFAVVVRQIPITSDMLLTRGFSMVYSGGNVTACYCFAVEQIPKMLRRFLATTNVDLAAKWQQYQAEMRALSCQVQKINELLSACAKDTFEVFAKDGTRIDVMKVTENNS